MVTTKVSVAWSLGYEFPIWIKYFNFNSYKKTVSNFEYIVYGHAHGAMAKVFESFESLSERGTSFKHSNPRKLSEQLQPKTNSAEINVIFTLIRP